MGIFTCNVFGENLNLVDLERYLFVDSKLKKAIVRFAGETNGVTINYQLKYESGSQFTLPESNHKGPYLELYSYDSIPSLFAQNFKSVFIPNVEELERIIISNVKGYLGYRHDEDTEYANSHGIGVTRYIPLQDELTAKDIVSLVKLLEAKDAKIDVDFVKVRKQDYQLYLKEQIKSSVPLSIRHF